MNSATEFPPAAVESGTLLAGRYEVLRRIGSGGMGLVFEVADRTLDNTHVALKLLSPSREEEIADEEILARFRNEVLITRRLAHPNIVRTFDFGQLPDGRFYMTMEYIDGSTLEELIQREFFARSNIHYITLVLTKICDAIQEAHKIGVIHRDLKSANVLISRGGEVKVTDFGLARVRGAERRVTMTGECVGTPVYMSPEQVQGLACDHRTDIYSLGIIAFEMLTGHVPFNDESWYGLANKIVHEPLPTIAVPESRIPLWFEEFVLRSTKKEPDHRYASAEMAGSFLRQHLFALENEHHAESPFLEEEDHDGGFPKTIHFHDWANERQTHDIRREKHVLTLTILLLFLLLFSLLGLLVYAFQHGMLGAKQRSGPPEDFFRPMALAPPAPELGTRNGFGAPVPQGQPSPNGGFRIIVPKPGE